MDEDVTLDDQTQVEAENTKCKSIKRRLLVLFLMVAIVWIIIDTIKFGYSETLVDDFFDWLEDNPGTGTFAFILIYAIATAVLFIPGSLLTIGAGFAFGMALGDGIGLCVSSIAVFIGASLGSIVAFLLARYIMNDYATYLREKYTMFQAIDAAMENNGLKIMVLLRMSPIIPFNVLGYISGSTSINLTNYSLALVGMLPGVILYCAVGVIGCTLASNYKSPEHIISLVAGILFAIAGLIITSYYAKKELNRLLSKDKDSTSFTENIENDDLEKGEISGKALVNRTSTATSSHQKPDLLKSSTEL